MNPPFIPCGSFFQEVFQPLTSRDIQVLQGLCRSPYLQNFPSYIEELQAMAACDKKAEIQALHSVDETYLEAIIIQSILNRRFD